MAWLLSSPVEVQVRSSTASQFMLSRNLPPFRVGIGLMIATALEHNGAVVYIASRRLEILEKAAKEHAVSTELAPKLMG